ncbi:MAG: ABC transporter permease [Granulosicoccus sp.]|nr:ABC transporter permease [Granulosicoccus sp.]
MTSLYEPITDKHQASQSDESAARPGAKENEELIVKTSPSENKLVADVNKTDVNNIEGAKEDTIRAESDGLLPKHSGVGKRLAGYIPSGEQRNSIIITLSSILTGLAVWYWVTEINLDAYINFENVPSPQKVFQSFGSHLQTQEFYIHIGVSMRRILISYGFAVVVGVLLGVLMGRSKYFRAFVMPYIEIVRPIPAVAWIPLAILMWPTEESSIIYITYLGALFPIVLNTMHGVDQTPEVLVRASQSLGASKINIFWHVVLPAALPSISAGLAIGMGVSWFSLLAGEIISGQYGIGYFTWNAYSLINYNDIVVGMLVIGFLGTLSTFAVKMMTRPFLAWQEKSR